MSTADANRIALGVDVQQTLHVELGEFSLAAIEARAESWRVPLGVLLSQAVYYYVADGGSGRTAWTYPNFRRGEGAVGSAIDVSLNIDDPTWEAFAAVADRQRVSVESLIEHAALYFIADLDSSRVVQRILDSSG